MCSCKGKRIKSTGGNSSRVRWASIEVTFLAEITHWAPLNNVICWDHTHTHWAIKSIPSKSTLRRLLDLAGLHFTTSERSGPFWQSMLHNFLSRPLSFLGWTTAMFFWLDFHQTQSNLYKWFRMQWHDWSSSSPKRAHVTPLFISLHWLPVAARIQFKTLMLAYRTTTGSAPPYFHSLLQIYIPSRSLRSASERRLVVPSQRGSKSLSRTFSFTVPGRWNDFPTPIRNAGSLSIFKQQLKTHLFQHYLTLSFSPSLASLYLFEQCLRLGVIGTSSVCLPLQD